MTAASNSEARKRAAGIAASNPTAPEVAGTLEGAPRADSEALATTQGLLLQLLVDEYGDEEWAELGSLRRISRFVDDHFDAIIREHVTAALDEIERRIASSVSPNFALRHDGTEDPQAAAYVEGLHDAHEIVRGYRQEQGR